MRVRVAIDFHIRQVAEDVVAVDRARRLRRGVAIDELDRLAANVEILSCLPILAVLVARRADPERQILSGRLDSRARLAGRRLERDSAQRVVLERLPVLRVAVGIGPALAVNLPLVVVFRRHEHGRAVKPELRRGDLAAQTVGDRCGRRRAVGYRDDFHGPAVGAGHGRAPGPVYVGQRTVVAILDDPATESVEIPSGLDAVRVAESGEGSESRVVLTILDMAFRIGHFDGETPVLRRYRSPAAELPVDDHRGSDARGRDDIVDRDRRSVAEVVVSVGHHARDALLSVHRLIRVQRRTFSEAGRLDQASLRRLDHFLGNQPRGPILEADGSRSARAPVTVLDRLTDELADEPTARVVLIGTVRDRRVDGLLLCICLIDIPDDGGPIAVAVKRVVGNGLAQERAVELVDLRRLSVDERKVDAVRDGIVGRVVVSLEEHVGAATDVAALDCRRNAHERERLLAMSRHGADF